MTKQRHILGISGGKDSAALAIYMNQRYPELDMEYFFTDTGEELPEVYEFISRLEGYLGKEVNRINSDKEFSYWMKKYNISENIDLVKSEVLKINETYKKENYIRAYSNKKLDNIFGHIYLQRIYTYEKFIYWLKCS